MTFDQSEFDVRCEWGERGVRLLAPISDAVIIVDVMSFPTCVAIAESRGATVFPWRPENGPQVEFARSVNAELAGPRGTSRYSLSPASLIDIPQATRLVLPSPNGASLSFLAGRTPTYAGCLRNCRAVARAAMSCGRQIAVIPAGERWREDGSLRPALEDLVGAGAIIHHLRGSLSAESRAALAAYRNSARDLLHALRPCGSGKELAEMGFGEDIALIAEVGVDDCAPVLKNGAYVKDTK